MTDKKRDETKKQYEEPTLEKRERLIEVTEGDPNIPVPGITA